jgi:ankyrin repeat protein
MEAAQHGLIDVSCFLVERGANFNAEDTWGRTALMRDARGGRIEVVRFLTDLGVYSDDKDLWGSTELMRAAKNGHMGVVLFLMERGANAGVSAAEWKLCFSLLRRMATLTLLDFSFDAELI